MRIFEEDVEMTVTVSKVPADERNYYGLQSVGGYRALVYREDYKKGLFSNLSPVWITKGNFFDYIPKAENLEDYLTGAIREGLEVHEFKTYGELFAWLVS